MEYRQIATGARLRRPHDSLGSQVARATGLGTRSLAIAANGMRAALLLAGAWAALAGMAFAAAPKPTAPKPTAPHGKPAETSKLAQPMQVVIVTDGRTACAPNCAQWISAQGQIGSTTPAQFRRVFAALGKKKLPIFISSIGGSVHAAYAIGREIRKRGLDVAVESTIFETCETEPAACGRRKPKDGDKGRPEPIAAVCISSCVFVLAAGTQRLVPVHGYVGVHRLAAFQTLRQVRRTYQVQRKFENWRIVETRKLIAEQQLSSTTVEKDPDYAAVRGYFTEMGIDTAKIMPPLLATPHRDVHRLTAEERQATRLVTRVTAGHTLLPAASTAAAASVAIEAAAPAAPFPTTEPVAVAAQYVAPMADVSASLLVLRPPPQDVVELYLRLMSASGAPVRPAQYTADIRLANGKRLVAGSTGEDMIDPLYAKLAREDYCALRRAGDLSLTVTLTTAAHSGRPRTLLFDLAKVGGDAEFAAKHCK